MATPPQTYPSAGPLFKRSRNLNVLLRRGVCLLAAGVLMAMKAHVAEYVSPPAAQVRPAPMPPARVSPPEVRAAPVCDRSSDGVWCLKYYRRVFMRTYCKNPCN